MATTGVIDLIKNNDLKTTSNNAAQTDLTYKDIRKINET